MVVWKVGNNLWDKYKVVIGILILVLMALLLSNFSFIEVDISYAMLLNAITIIIGSISSIFGIVIAIYILAYSLFEKNYSNISLKLLNSKELSYYIQLYLSIIAIMIISNFLLKENINNVSLNLIGLGTTLYILSLALIYPIIRILISDSKSNKYIDELLSKLNDVTAREYLQPGKIEDLQQNPFYELSTLSKSLIIGNERILLIQILNYCEELIKQNINRNTKKDTNFSREFIKAFVYLFVSFKKSSEESNEIWCMGLIFDNYINIREYGVINKIQYYDFIEYEEFIHNMIVKCLRNGNLEIVNSYLRFLFNFIELNIDNNLPDESELFYFNNEADVKSDYTKSGQWEYLSYSILHRIDSINQEAIKVKEIEVVTSSFHLYNCLFRIVIKSEKLGDKQKRSLISYGSFQLENTILKIIDKELDYKLLTTYEPFVLSGGFSINNDLFLILFKAYTNIILHLSKHRVLSSFELNQYGTLGRSLATYIDQGETIELVMKKIVGIMVTISKHIEHELTMYSMKLYTELYKQSESIIKWCKNSEAKNPQLILELENMIKEMDSINRISEIMSDENTYIKVLLDELKSI
jgi:hypothetical protein